MSRDRAAYMREYRAIQRAKIERSRQPVTVVRLDAADRIAELEAEVRHLKAELAKRGLDLVLDTTPMRVATPEQIARTDRFNSRPFTPVPKSRK